MGQFLIIIIQIISLRRRTLISWKKRASHGDENWDKLQSEALIYEKIIKFYFIRLKRSFLTVNSYEKWTLLTVFFIIFKTCCRLKEPRGAHRADSAGSYRAAFHQRSLSRELTQGKNKTLPQIIVEILVSRLIALLFSQRCPKLLERKAD